MNGELNNELKILGDTLFLLILPLMIRPKQKVDKKIAYSTEELNSSTIGIHSLSKTYKFKRKQVKRVSANNHVKDRRNSFECFYENSKHQEKSDNSKRSPIKWKTTQRSKQKKVKQPKTYRKSGLKFENYQNGDISK